MKQPITAIDPSKPENWGKPLWFVYGHEAFPQFLCAMIKFSTGDMTPVIWGYSVYQRKPGFRTLGVSFSSWRTQSMCFAFDEQQNALDFLKTITTPKVKS